jgi:hypothetical protein
MSDPWMTESDIAGHWSGHYAHRVGPDVGRVFPIAADLECRSGRVTGTMTDEVTEIRRSYKDAVNAVADRMTDVALSQAYALIDQSPGATLETTLPRESDLRGKWDGRTLAFAKTYRGTYTVSLNLGDRQIMAHSRDGHRVEYRGAYDPPSRTIRGEWIIRYPGLFGRFLKPTAVGDFVLEKRR